LYRYAYVRSCCLLLLLVLRVDVVDALHA
jgi:hypothetical protein